MSPGGISSWILRLAQAHDVHRISFLLVISLVFDPFAIFCPLFCPCGFCGRRFLRGFFSRGGNKDSANCSKRRKGPFQPDETIL